MRGIRIRWPILAVSLVGLVLVVALLGWHFLGPGPTRVGPASASGRTNILLLGRSEDGSGASLQEAVVVSLDEGSDAVFLAIPAELSVKRSNGSLDILRDVDASEGSEATEDVVCGLLGIDFDVVIAWDDVAFSTLVDLIGGLVIAVDSDVAYAGTEEGDRIEIRAGEQTLGGREALAYVRGESSESSLLRQQNLIRGLLERGFSGVDARTTRQRVRDVHPLLETDASLSMITTLAVSVSAIEPEALRVTALPVEAASVDGRTVFEPRAVETERLVATLVRGLELLTPSEVQVAVFNGNGVRLMASRTADYLRARGFEVTRIANAESFDYPTSYIVVLTDEAKAWVLRDAMPNSVSIVFPDAFAEHYEALASLVPFGTDLLLIAGAGLEI